tara:strand:+ start:850 stop:1947 length:1098 start_codon:yes stop_codon:yes gene_type:complete
MKIDIILPYKEIFSSKKASAVSLTVKNSAEFSIYKKQINVYGQSTNFPFDNVKFVGIKTNKILHLGNNKSVYLNYVKKRESTRKRIIEFHNRPYVFNKAIKLEKKNPITLHFHNDPRNMKGSKTIKERKNIAENAEAVYFVSDYIKNCFVDGLDKDYNNFYIIPNAIQRTLNKKPNKNKEVLFIGRLVEEKGCHLYVNAIKSIVKKFPEWKFRIVGTEKAGQKALTSTYAKKLIRDFESLGKNTEYLGFISNVDVSNILKKTSILIVPSIWQEPFALTALEGVCNGAAVIASKVGGMQEMLEDVGMLINDIDEIKLEKSIISLLENENLLNSYHNKSWINYKYNQKDIVKIQDEVRTNIFNKYNY